MPRSRSLSPTVTACLGPIESALERAIGNPDNPPALTEALRYALLAGGKRLRPMLAWHSCTAVGAAPGCSLPAGCAVELVHAFSLVHDDLPSMDNDDLRRGKPTLHRHAGEAMAILAGDAMLALAFDILARQSPPGLTGLLVGELASDAGRMIVGQVYDTVTPPEADLPDRARLELIHRNKTGALIRASCRMGALLGLAANGAAPDQALTSSELSAITTYAEAIGLMFQIVDDLLDVEQTPEHAGKGTGKDAQAGKLTYPGVMGVESSRREVEQLVRRAVDAVAALGAQAEGLRELAAYMGTRTR